jgi:8-oxo-dGTP pyrophosphatase MutT (NUDIX family)
MNEWDQLDAAQLAERLLKQLGRGLPGRSSHRAMAPQLAYGRHNGPIPDDARKAAVLLVLHPADAGWSIPAMLRPATMKTHAGQVSLPGGVIELGETATETGLREFAEELGAATAEIRVLGALSPVYVFISNFQVTPVLAISPHALAFHPSVHEVAAVVELPLVRLIDPACIGSHRIQRKDLTFRAPHFDIAGHRIWGATSLILAEFAELARRMGC